VQSPKLRYPAKSKDKGMVGAVILGFDFASDGKIINPKVLAAVPSNEFDQELLETVSKWRYRPQKKKDVGVSCKLERSNVVNSFVFLLD
ncbi:MAG: energy transducer TonB, partial [Pseudomonadota bacterium]